MKRFGIRWALFTVALVITWGLAGDNAGRAGEIFQEPFAYPDGPLVGPPASPWVAHSQEGNGPALVQDGSLILSADGAEDSHRPLPGGPFETDGPVGRLYISFLLTCLELPTESGAYFAHFRSGGAHRARIWISRTGAVDGMFRVGIGNSSGADALSGQVNRDLSTGQVYRVVARYEMATGFSSIGLDPIREADLNVTASDPVGLTRLQSLALRQGRGMGTVHLQDLAVHDAFPGTAPRLEVSWDGVSLKLSWPADAEGFRLESTPVLEPAAWSEEAVVPVLEGDRWVVRGMPTAEKRFFRLKQP